MPIGSKRSVTDLHRLRDRAAVLTAASFILLSPLAMQFFYADASIFGVPLLFVYVFVVWSVSILLGGLIASALVRTAESSPRERGAIEGKEVKQDQINP